MRRLLLLTALVFGFGASQASAAPILNLEMHHNQTHFAPGDTGQYWFEIDNVGDSATSGPVTLTVTLPSGINRDQILDAQSPTENGFRPTWNCAGVTTVTCTTADSVPRHRLARGLILSVNVPEGVTGEVFASAVVSGGGAVQPAGDFELTRIDPVPAPFGILAPSFTPDFVQANGTVAVRASGAHPDLLTVPFDFNSVDLPPGPGNYPPDQKIESEHVRDLRVDLPRGFLGDPTAVGECTRAQFTVRACPPSSQIGRFDASTFPYINTFRAYHISVPVYNMTHPRGAISDLAFVIQGNPVHVKVSLDAANGYAITSRVENINESLPPFHQKLTIWGVPGDSSHDSERCPGAEQIDTGSECPLDGDEKPFLTVPFRCGVDHSFRVHHYDSWQDTGDFGPLIDYELPGHFEECDKPRFDPEIELNPTGDEAGTPTGLDVSVHVPQNDNPNALATPPIKETTVTLPEGMTVNPAFANGLEGCSESEIGLGTNGRVRCPDNSRVGEVELTTPLLPGRVEGSMYLAEQKDNPFDSLLAFYIAMHDTEERGVLIKVPGHVELDDDGQITTTFDDLPQFPFEDLTLKFRSGERAPLVNPPTCGDHRIEATMASYAQPNEDLDLTNTYELDEGPGGADCVSRLGSRPFNPQLVGGTLNPVAGAFSPLALQVTRTDAEQEFGAVHGTAPPGFSASIADIPKCTEAQIASAMRRDDPGEGKDEQDRPSCPAASQVGRVVTGAGAGPSPIYVPGKVYLAGPYKGALLSGVAIVPAVAGPVDLGVVVVRAPAYVNPVTAQVSIRSDSLPQVVNGVLIRVRDVRIHLDRPNFTINPTSCEEKGLWGTLFSSEGKAATLFNRFQVGECGSLGFEPRLGIRLKGGTKRGGHPALRAVYVPKAGDANVKRLALTFPNSEFVENANFRTICTRVQFAAKACPPGAVYGRVKAWTPLLDTPLEGPVVLRSSDNLLPDAVFVLNGEISAEVAVRIDSAKGRLRATVQSAPDVPVSRVVVQMQASKKGLFVNSRNICKGANRARANIHAQSGKQAVLRPKFRAQGCQKKKGRARGKRKK